MTEDEGGQLPDAASAEQISPLLSSVQAYLRGGADTAAMDMLAREISPGIVNAWTSFLEVPEGSGLRIQLQAIIENSTITLTDDDNIRTENVTRALTKATNEGTAGLTPVQLLIVVLVWLLAFGMPVIQETLPPEAQSVISGDIGTAGLALAVTTLIIQQRGR